MLGQDAKLAGEDGYMFVQLLVSLLEFFTVSHEAVKEMVNDVRLEDLDALSVGHLLGVSLHLDIEGEDDGVPGGKVREQ